LCALAVTLAVTMAMRSQVLPEIPTLSDFVLGYEASLLFGVDVPGLSVDAQRKERLHNEPMTCVRVRRAPVRLSTEARRSIRKASALHMRRIAILRRGVYHKGV
jgi:hypothetical protein